jgi:hypothetical protein
LSSRTSSQYEEKDVVRDKEENNENDEEDKGVLEDDSFPFFFDGGVSERDANKTGKVLNIISNERGLVSNRDKYRYI